MITRGTSLLARTVAGTLLTCAAAVLLVTLAPTAAASGPVTQTFSTPGGPYTYTVPAGVSLVHAEAIGGAGGVLQINNYSAGKGADVVADLPVSGGQTLYVYVAGNGSTSGGGVNGGGAPASTSSSAGGGGGASDVRTTSGDLNTRILVAAGGGGGQSCGTAGDAGMQGTQGCGCAPGVGANGGGPAMPGTDTAGGAGGGGCDGTSGTPGLFGTGGNGGARPSGGDYGPGGGGGWWGGGGGGPYSGGAGGSSHWEAAAANTSVTITTSAPKVALSYTLPPAAPPPSGPGALSGPSALPPALRGSRRDVLRDLGIPRHRLISVNKHGDFAFPPTPIFLRAGDTLAVVAKLNVGRRRGLGQKAGAALVTTYGTGSVTATHDGPAQVGVHATPAGRAALKRNGRVFVSVHLAFRSSAKLGSSTSSKDFRLKLKKRGK